MTRPVMTFMSKSYLRGCSLRDRRRGIGGHDDCIRLHLTRPVIDETSADAIAALIDQDASEMTLDGALDRVPDAERQALELRVVEELSYREIADELGKGASRTSSSAIRGELFKLAERYGRLAADPARPRARARRRADPTQGRDIEATEPEIMG